jgi:hypothetical protein
MLRIALVIVTAASISLIGIAGVRAMPAMSQKASVESGFITKTAGDRGPGWHRNAYGRCVPN